MAQANVGGRAAVARGYLVGMSDRSLFPGESYDTNTRLAIVLDAHNRELTRQAERNELRGRSTIARRQRAEVRGVDRRDWNQDQSRKPAIPPGKVKPPKGQGHGGQ